MALYDPHEERLALRIVYDGVGGAGKTTNLQQLSTLFVAQRATGLYSPANLRGRTLYFDYMQIMAGVVCGVPLLCQIVSVPGQVVLTPRRRHLLESADVVVYVCDSRRDGLEQARAGLRLLAELDASRETPVPVVLQANKQDQRDALDGAVLAGLLGCEPACTVSAVASDGVGVVDTFVNAVRAAARSIQARAEVGGLRVRVARAETAATMLARMAELHVDAEGAAELLLEEAQAAYVLCQLEETVTRDARALRHARAAADDLSARLDRSDEPARVSHGARVLLPSADVPTGFVWPAHTGRAVVRALALPPDMELPWNERGVVEHRAHGHVVRTSVAARFPDGEGARQLLVRRARACAQLDHLLPSDTVLVAQSAPSGECCLWTVCPELPTLDGVLARRAITNAILLAFGQAVAEAVRTCLRHGFSVDVELGKFGVQHDTVRYVGDVASEVLDPMRATDAIHDLVNELARVSVDPHWFIEGFERELRQRLGGHEPSRAPRPFLVHPAGRSSELCEALARAAEV